MKDLLKRAAAEIRYLRRENELLSAKVEMIELFSCVFYTAPAPAERQMGEDVAYRLDAAISDFDAEKDPG